MKQEIGFREGKDLRYLIMSIQVFHNGRQTAGDGEISASVMRICKTEEEAVTLVRNQFYIMEQGCRDTDKWGFENSRPVWSECDNPYWQHTGFKYHKTGSFGCNWDCEVKIITDWTGNFEINDSDYLF